MKFIQTSLAFAGAIIFATAAVGTDANIASIQSEGRMYKGHVKVSCTMMLIHHTVTSNVDACI